MFIVVTRSAFTPDSEQEVLALAEQSAPIARAQPGFVDMKIHIDHDHTHLMTYWVWESRDHHERCMASNDWKEYNPKWESLMKAGKLQFEINSYEMLDY